MCLFCQPGNSSRLRFRAAGRSVAERLAGVADIVLTGGDIVTMDVRLPRAGALSIRDGLVQTVGSTEEVAARKGRSTRVVDLHGATVIPGMILPTLRKDPVALLDWQDIDLARAGGDVRGYLSRTIAPPLFSAPVFIHFTNAAGAVSDADLLASLEDVCGPAPLAVRIGDRDGGLVNQAMLRRAGRSAPGDPRGPLLTASDLAALLEPFAEDAAQSASSLARALERSIAVARSDGYTMIVDRAMGSLAGRAEVEAAALQFAGRGQVRIRGVAHRRLREEWDGRLPEEIRPDMLSVDAALLEGGQPAANMLDEARSLSGAGWRLAFSARCRDEFAVVLDVCRALAPFARDRAPSVELALVPDAADAEVLRGLGAVLIPLPEAGCEGPDTIADQRDAGDRLAAVTRAAAERCRMGDVAGMIAPGKYADFAVLDGPPQFGRMPRVSATWVDGIPV